MTNREPAISRSQKPSSHQSIEDAPPMMRRIGGSALSPNVWTQRSTPLARTILSLGSIGRISGPGMGGCSGAWALSLFVMTGRSFPNGCSIVYSEHTAIFLRFTIDPSLETPPERDRVPQTGFQGPVRPRLCKILDANFPESTFSKHSGE